MSGITLSITTFRIMKLINIKAATVSIKDAQQSDTSCKVFICLESFMDTVVVFDFMLNVNMLNVIGLSVIMLYVVMLSVVAP